MSLNQKHIRVAEILKWRIESTQNNMGLNGQKTTNNIIDAIHTITNDLADYFQEDNQNFNRHQFYEAVRGSD